MLVVPAILDTFASLKDKTLKLTFYCNELNPQQLLKVAENIQQFGYLAFKNDKYKNKELDTLESIKGIDVKKSNSQLLRSVLFRNFEKNKEGYKEFNEYYDFKMNKIINFFKDKLND